MEKVHSVDCFYLFVGVVVVAAGNESASIHKDHCQIQVPYLVSDFGSVLLDSVHLREITNQIPGFDLKLTFKIFTNFAHFFLIPGHNANIEPELSQPLHQRQTDTIRPPNYQSP